MDKTVPLVNIQGYADKWKIHRNTISRLAKSGGVTVYETPKGKKFLNADEIPPKETLIRSLK